METSIDIEAAFNAALKFLNETTDAVPESVKYDLYGLYQTARNGVAPKVPGKISVKLWEAWQKFSSLDPRSAMQEYCNVVASNFPAWKKKGYGNQIRGHLMKKGDTIKKWRKRYFVFESRELRYFLDENKKLRGSIVIVGAKLSWSPGACEFSILTGDKSFHLRADSAAKAKQWVEALQAVAQPSSEAAATLAVHDYIEESSGSLMSPDEDVPVEAVKKVAVTPAKKQQKKKRPTDFSVPSEFRATVDRMMAECRARAPEGAPGWELSFEKNGVRCFLGTENDGFASAKGYGFIPFPARCIHDYLGDISRKGEMDKQFDKGHHIEVGYRADSAHVYKRYSPHFSIDYLKYKPIWPTSARDFVVHAAWRVDEAGAITWIFWDAIHPDFPADTTEKVVRGRVLWSAWVIEPLKEDRGCRVTYLVKSDLGGKIPGFVVKKVTSGQPMLVAEMRAVLQKTVNAEEARTLPPVTNIAVSELEMEPDVEVVEEEQEEEESAVAVEQSEFSRAGANRFGGYTLPPQHERRIERGIVQLVDMCNPNNGNWKRDKVKNGVSYYLNPNSELLEAMGHVLINQPITTVLDAIWDLSNRDRFADDQDEAYVIDEFDPHTRVDYIRAKPVFPTNARDFCSLVHWRVLEDGRAVIVSMALKHPDCPSDPQKKIVRGEITLGGWMVERAGERKTRLFYMVRGDIKGSVPTFVTKIASSSQPSILKGVKRYLHALPTQEECPLTNHFAPKRLPLRAPTRAARGPSVDTAEKKNDLPSNQPAAFEVVQILPWASVVLLILWGFGYIGGEGLFSGLVLGVFAAMMLVRGEPIMTLREKWMASLVGSGFPHVRTLSISMLVQRCGRVVDVEARVVKMVTAVLKHSFPMLRRRWCLGNAFHPTSSAVATCPLRMTVVKPEGVVRFVGNVDTTSEEQFLKLLRSPLPMEPPIPEFWIKFLPAFAVNVLIRLSCFIVDGFGFAPLPGWLRGHQLGDAVITFLHDETALAGATSEVGFSLCNPPSEPLFSYVPLGMTCLIEPVKQERFVVSSTFTIDARCITAHEVLQFGREIQRRLNSQE